MKNEFIPLMLGVYLAFAYGDACADTSKPVDTSKLGTTNVYTSTPQERIFVESLDFTIPISQLQGVQNLFILSSIWFNLGSAHVANNINFDKTQAQALPIHALLDGYDGKPVLHEGADKAIRALSWLHLKDVQFTTGSTGQFLTLSQAAGSDSVITLDLFYSITRDNRGAVVAGIMKLYSRALSPPVDPYDPSSKSAWLRKPVATREYVFQSRLLQLPPKTPVIIDQLASEADKLYDGVGLKREFDALAPRAVDEDSSGQSARIADKEKIYLTLLQDIKDPSWQSGDSRLMYALMWSANDDAPLKQALQDGADALQDLISRGMGPIPAGATPVAKDANGKNAVFLVSQDADRTIYMVNNGAVFSVSSSDPVDTAMVTPPGMD